MLSPSDLRLIDALHGGFPLVTRPFAHVGATLRMAEEQVMGAVRRLLQEGILTRFGPLFQIERAGGRFVLAAMQVPVSRFDEVAANVNALPEVAHNYRRDHRLNMWFVIAAESQAQADQALAHIRHLTDLEVLAFPKEREYFVELRLPLLGPWPGADGAATSVLDGDAAAPSHASTLPRRLTPFERQLLQATQSGLPVAPQPYAVVAGSLRVSEDEVIAGLSTLQADGVIRRIGAVPHHYRLGFVANGMSVWDVDDAQVDALGEAVGRLPGVSHCYRRPRHGHAWPYNLFAMLHGRSRADVQVQAAQLRAVLGDACRSHDVLYSSAVLKKTGLRLRTSDPVSDEAVPSAVKG